MFSLSALGLPRLRAVLMLCLGASWIGGCSGSAISDLSLGKQKEAAQVEPNVFPAEYKQEIAAFMRSYLENPRQVRDAYVGTPVLKPVARAQSYVTCVRYNPRNSENKYEGNNEKLVIFLGGKMNQFLPSDPQLCAGLAYQRYPEIESMVP